MLLNTKIVRFSNGILREKWRFIVEVSNSSYFCLPKPFTTTAHMPVNETVVKTARADVRTARELRTAIFASFLSIQVKIFISRRSTGIF